MSGTIVLSIESGVSFGSLSLLKNGNEITNWIGTGKRSTSENLIPEIENLLERGRVRREEIGKIAISTGPGSFTGIRAGIATTIGLSKAFGCKCLGIPLFEAMALGSNVSGRIITAFGLGENEICWQIFDHSSTFDSAKNKPQIGSMKKFGSELQKSNFVRLILHSGLRPSLEHIEALRLNINKKQITYIDNLAKYIGLGSEVIASGSRLTPIYAEDTRIL